MIEKKNEEGGYFYTKVIMRQARGSNARTGENNTMVQSWRDNTFFFLSEIKLIIFSYAPSYANWHSFIHSFTLSFFPPFSPALSLAFSFSLSYALYDNGCNNNCYCDVKLNTLTLCERARLSRNLINCHALRALLIYAQNYLMCKNFASNRAGKMISEFMCHIHSNVFLNLKYRSRLRRFRTWR